jgi:hypothetical protein
MSQTFTIVSSHAPLVEVDSAGPSVSEGPFVDRTGGLAVVPGVLTTAPVSLLNGFIRRFRVDASRSTNTMVAVTESPHGALVGLTRCVPVATMERNTIFSVKRWPRLYRGAMRVAPGLAAHWHLRTNLSWAPCRWEAVSDGISDHVVAQGDDVVIVLFVVP